MEHTVSPLRTVSCAFPTTCVVAAIVGVLAMLLCRLNLEPPHRPHCWHMPSPFPHPPSFVYQYWFLSCTIMGDCTTAGRGACLSMARSKVATAESVSSSRMPAIVMYAEKTFETVMALLEASKDVTACSMLLSMVCSMLVVLRKYCDRGVTGVIWGQDGIGRREPPQSHWPPNLKIYTRSLCNQYEPVLY